MCHILPQMGYCHKNEVGWYIVVKETLGEFAHCHHEIVKLYLIHAIIDSCKNNSWAAEFYRVFLYFVKCTCNQIFATSSGSL